MSLKINLTWNNKTLIKSFNSFKTKSPKKGTKRQPIQKVSKFTIRKNFKNNNKESKKKLKVNESNKKGQNLDLKQQKKMKADQQVK